MVSCFRRQTLAAALLFTSPLAVNAAENAVTVELPTVSVSGARSRLDAARNGLSPDTGSTVYQLNQQDIQNLPQGERTPINQVVLQTPGVVQDSYGQLHVRGDHANVQYRINGVVIPEAISGFGQALETRFADHISILTGALPAQYGYRTAAVVDIKTKGAEMEPGGDFGVTVGQDGHAETSLQWGGTQGPLSYYLTGSYLRNQLGIENPTDAAQALHDRTQQAKGFAYLSYVLGESGRISLVMGSTHNRFQIPNVPGQTPMYQLSGVTQEVDSRLLNANQHERNRFAVLSYEGSAGARVDYQVALFNRHTDVHYRPDPVGDLIFNGIGADIYRRNVANGIQADLSLKANAAHTWRAGLYAQFERFDALNDAKVFLVDDAGVQRSSTPVSITDNTRISGRLWGVYVQDQWRPLTALTVNVGLRYDQVNTVVDERQISPRMGLVYEMSPSLRVHAGYARYFTPPPTEAIDLTTVQQFLGSSNALPSDANTSVRSERSHYVDLGLAYQATPRLTLGVDAYYRNVAQLQDEGQFGNALIFSAFNYRHGRIGGLEMSLNYRDPLVSAYANLAFSRALGTQIESGQFNFEEDELATIAQRWVHLDHDQTVTASAGLAYRMAPQWTLSADALYGSGVRKGFVNSQHLSAYATVNLALAKRMGPQSPLGSGEVRVSVLNLFDSVYQLRDGSGIGVGAPQFGQRRSVYLSVNKSF